MAKSPCVYKNLPEIKVLSLRSGASAFLKGKLALARPRVAGIIALRPVFLAMKAREANAAGKTGERGKRP
jgi:hypothetical protein